MTLTLTTGVMEFTGGQKEKFHSVTTVEKNTVMATSFDKSRTSDSATRHFSSPWTMVRESPRKSRSS